MNNDALDNYPTTPETPAPANIEELVAALSPKAQFRREAILRFAKRLRQAATVIEDDAMDNLQKPNSGEAAYSDTQWGLLVSLVSFGILAQCDDLKG